MNKKLLALAVASVCAAPAFAQTSNVTLGGRAALGIDNYSASGATDGSAGNTKSRTRVLDTTSRIILRGTEDLGNGLRAVFDIETGIRMDTASNLANSGAADSASGFFGTRHAWAGLEGGFGRITLGKQNVYWNSFLDTQTSVYHVPTAGYFSSSNGGRVAGPTARTNNTVQYQSPTFGGLSTRLSYATNSDTAQLQTNTDAKIYGVTLEGRWGPIGAQADWSRNDFTTPATGPRQKNEGLKALVGYTYLPGARITLFGQQLKNTDIGANIAMNPSGTPLNPGSAANFALAGDDLKQKGFGIGWEHLFGNIRLMASYMQNQKVTGCTGAADCGNSGSKGYNIGLNYLLSKRTHLTAYYSQIKNEANQTSDFVAGGWTAAQSQSRGADPRMIGVGMVHNF